MADFLRALVHIEAETHPMACTVAEVALELPERESGGIVHLAARSSGREDCHGQSDMAPEHKRVILHFQFSARTERHSPGNVGGTVAILAA